MKSDGASRILMGKLKEKTGKTAGNRRLETRSTSDQMDGNFQKKVGEIKKVLGR